MKNKIFTIVLVIIFIILILIISTILNKKVVGQNINGEENSIELLEVTSENFDDEVLKSDKKVLIDFYADWCQPCKILEPTIKEIASEKEEIKVVRINIDEETDLATRYEIMSIPTLVLIKDGEEMDRIVGAAQKYTIVSMIDKY